MNLHQIASGAISSVNPFIPMVFSINTGFTQSADYKRVPTFTTVTKSGQFQNLSAKELEQLNGLNLEGDLGAIYVNGEFDGVVRGLGKGGDKVTFNGKTWLVVQVLEQWPDWCKIAICYNQGRT